MSLASLLHFTKKKFPSLFAFSDLCTVLMILKSLFYENSFTNRLFIRTAFKSWYFFATKCSSKNKSASPWSASYCKLEVCTKKSWPKFLWPLRDSVSSIEKNNAPRRNFKVFSTEKSRFRKSKKYLNILKYNCQYSFNLLCVRDRDSKHTLANNQFAWKKTKDDCS